MAENLLAGAGELTDRQDKLDKAIAHLQAEVAAAGGGPWEGRLDLMEEVLTEWTCDQDNRIEELKKRVARKQRELVGLAEGEEEEETPPRSLVSATAVAAPQEAGTPDAGPQEVAWHQGEPGSYQQACPDGQVWGEQQGAERRQQGQALELGEVKVAGGY